MSWDCGARGARAQLGLECCVYVNTRTTVLNVVCIELKTLEGRLERKYVAPPLRIATDPN